MGICAKDGSENSVVSVAMPNYKDRFTQVIKRKISEMGGPKPFSDFTGIPYKTVSNWKNAKGVIRPIRDNQKILEKAFRRELEDAGLMSLVEIGDPVRVQPEPLQGADLEEDFVRIPYVDIQPAASPGGDVRTKRTIIGELAFARWWCAKKGNPENFVLFRVIGDSMWPTIPDGATVLVDESQAKRFELAPGRYYLINKNGEGTRVKRLERKKDGVWQICSDNDIYEPEDITPEDDVQILGRVINVSFDL